MKNLESLGKHCLFLMMLLCLFPLGIQAQNYVKGTILDENGEPVIGATIKVQGSNEGVVSDLDGHFSLNVKPGSRLAVSYVGYKTQLLKASNNMKIVLSTDSKFIDEVVVVGYGVQKKSDLTGSVGTVNEKDLANRSTSDAGAALQGKVSGVQVLNFSGAPGDAASIRVRGYSSNSGNLGPLLIVDGLKVDNIQYLDPSMIENIEVLKDAASAAIYGAEAGNGVILITTKKGEAGHASISYDMKLVNQSIAHKAEIFNAKDFIAYKELSGIDMDTKLKANNYDGTNTDWQDVIFGPSWSTQHSLTFQGGNRNGHFFASLNMLNNDGIVVGNKDQYKRLTAQINADYNLFKWISVGTNTSIEKWSTRAVPQMNLFGSVYTSALTLDPLTPVYFDDPSEFPSDMLQAYKAGKNILKDPSNGKWYAVSKYQTDDNGNPLLQRDLIDQKSDGINVRGTLYANITPFKGLTFTSRFGYRLSFSNVHSYTPAYYANSMVYGDNYDISATDNTGYYYQWENFANYNFQFGKNDFTAMAGMSYIENNTDNVKGEASGPDILTGYESNFHYLDYVNNNSSTTKSISNAPGRLTSISYFGRLVYNFDNRYGLQANFRADAFDSSKLAKNNRWGYFPSFSAGWTVSNEKFFKNVFDPKTWSFLKLRASWGRNGNINVLSGYPYATTISYNSYWYQYDVDDPGVSYGSAPSGLANPKLKWETSDQVDLGLDARFLNDRLTLGIDYFNKKTRDLLVSVPVVNEIGVDNEVMNAGRVRNRGLEIELSWKNHINDFRYEVSGNFSSLSNKVTYLDPAVGRIVETISGCNNPMRKVFEAGHSIWYFYGYKYDGVDSKTGAAKIHDFNGDGVINEDDMTDIGSPIPTYTYGITLNMAYKGFDFTLFGTGQGGNKIFNLAYRADTPLRNSLRYYYKNAWTTDNHKGSMPDPKQVVNDWHFWGSSASEFSGAFFKFKEIQLGYTLPKYLIRKVMLSNVRVYVSLDDFFTITKYPGLDPETATMNNNSWLMGCDVGSFPTSKKFIMGLNITF